MIRFSLVVIVALFVSLTTTQPPVPLFPCTTSCECGSFEYPDNINYDVDCIACVGGQCRILEACSVIDFDFCTDLTNLTCSEVQPFCSIDSDCLQEGQCSQCIKLENQTLGYCRKIKECPGSCNVATCQCESEIPPESAPESAPSLPIVLCNSTFQCSNYSGIGGSGAFICSQCVEGQCQETLACPEGQVCFNDVTEQCTGQIGELVLCNNSLDCNQTLQCSQCIFVNQNLGFCRTLFECPGNCDLELEQCTQTPSLAPELVPGMSLSHFLFVQLIIQLVCTVSIASSGTSFST